MNWISNGWRRLRVLWHGDRFDRDLREEMEFHLALQIEENVNQGMSPEQARQAACRQFGNSLLLKEKSRDSWGLGWIDTLCRDLKYSVRSLRRHPGSTAASVALLALAIGANTAVFSIIYGFLWRALPVPHPEELRLAWQQIPGEDPKPFSFPVYRMLLENAKTVAGVATFQVSSPALFSTGQNGSLESLYREYVSSTYFTVLGLRPAAGRFFTAAEDRTISTALVIGFDYWQRQFNGDPGAVGSTLYMNKKPFTIIGVMPKGFTGIAPERPTQIWTQITDGMWNQGRNDPDHIIHNHGYEYYRILVRLRPDRSEAQAVTEMKGIFKQCLALRVRDLPAADHARILARNLALSPGGAGYSWMGHRYLKPLTVLMILVGLVLLLACAHLANLLLARTVARAREMAIRLAVGAARRHLIRQLLMESWLLALLSGGFAVLFAYWGAASLTRLYQITINVKPDLHLLAFTAGVTLLTGLLFGLWPAWAGSRSSLAALLKSAGSGARGGIGQIGRILVVAQVAISVILLAGAGLFSRTLGSLKGLDPGYDAKNVIITKVVTPSGYAKEANQPFWRTIDKLRHAPGVIAAAGGLVAADTPMDPVEPEDGSSPSAPPIQTQWREITDGFFETLRTPLLKGRAIERRDCGQHQRHLAVVNETLARALCGDSDPLGKRFYIRDTHGPSGRIGPLEIVGVVADARYGSLKQQPTCEVFTPIGESYGGQIVIRLAMDPRAFVAKLPHWIQQNEPGLRVLETTSLTTAKDHSITQERMLASLSGFFGLIGLVLAALGIFGVVSYNMVQRTQEIGIRMALGASRWNILCMVMQEVFFLITAGLAIGLPVVLAQSRLVASLLYEVQPNDPATLIGAVLLLGATALLGAYLPARRATRMSPLSALRLE